MTRVELATRPASGAWHAPRTVAKSPKLGLEEPQIAVDAKGETIVAWICAGTDKRVQAVVLGPSGTPEGPAQTLSSRGRSGQLRLAVNARGSAMVLWRRSAKAFAAIEAATRSPGNRFSGAVVISRADDAEPAAAVEPDGDAAILFTRILSTQPGSEPASPGGVIPVSTQGTAVEVASRTARGRWTPARPLLLTGKGSSYAPQLAANPARDELIAVFVLARFRSYPGQIDASLSTVGNDWQAPVALAPQEARNPSIVLGANGDATAAWVAEQAPTGGDSLQASSYEP
ncbi:MAG TPA: hypothetical protein VMD79_04780 [Solirubrobacteraceae bacterium]|nr:hypothetical protein [Solirubrobacteraceae bacterium]